MKALRAEVAAHPDDFELRRQLDFALASRRKFPDIIKMWDDFIAHHPGDARAYRERGGAYYQLHDHAHAKQNLLHACDMGDPRSCKLAKRLHFR